MNRTLEYVRGFTQLYQRYADDKYRREVECTFFMHLRNRTTITADTYYVSAFPSAPVGFGSRSSGFMYYLKDDVYREALVSMTPEEKEEALSLYDYWKTQDDKTTLHNEFSNRIKTMMPSDDYFNTPYTSFPLFRYSGAYLDFQKLVTLGLDGLAEEITASTDFNDNRFLQASALAVADLQELIRAYRDDAKLVNPQLAIVLDNIVDNPPKTMREAIQLIWLYVGISEARNYGRMDAYLAPFRSNHDSDYLDIEKYFEVIQLRNTIFNGRIILGGRDHAAIPNADYISLLALEVTKNRHFTEPQLTLRCYADMSKEVFDRAIDCIRDGCSYPLLYSDEVNVPNVAHAFKVSEEVAETYVPFGCGEYVLDHQTLGAPNGIINLTKVLEGVLNHGKCMLTGTKITKNYIDNPKSFDELLSVVETEIDYQLDVLAEQERAEYQYMESKCSYLYSALLYDNCIERRKDTLEGGIDGLGGTIETYGNINLADSLLAIKQLVFEQKLVTMTELVRALRDNFRDAPKLKIRCQNVPKYGNDLSDVDAFVSDMNQFVAKSAQSKADKYHLSTYLAVIINNETNSTMGNQTGASADGREAHAPLANGLTPQSGAEHSGLTAVLNSVSAQNVGNMAGCVYNLKLSSDLANHHTEAVKVLLKTFMSSGGSQIMISVINQKDLLDALVHPEKYPNLIVRVGGFSARFIDLDPLTQRDIIERMEY